MAGVAKGPPFFYTESMSRRLLLFLALFTLFFSHGCATNPVTGRQELHLVSEPGEIKIGKENYLSAQQSQGGEYRVESGLSSYVDSVGKRLVAVCDRPHLPYEFVVLNNPVPNAWALPGGKIAVNRGLLLELQSESELAAVLSHEIVHAAARHGAKSMERGMLLQAGMLGLVLATSRNEYSNLIVGAASLGAALISTKYSRDQELESDHYGMKYMARAGYDPHAAVTLQETFLRLEKEKKGNWLDGLFASHPPSEERVRANRALAETLPKGEEGKEKYLAKTAGLIKSKPAYDALEKGRKSLEKKNTAEALARAEEAIALEPREALFHELKADAVSKEKKYKDALDHYNRTVEENDGFFRFYLKRGLIKEKLGDTSGARQDIQKSAQLLPTALAHNALGKFALAEGQTQTALEHFRVAAESNSDVGKEAGRSLALLELPHRPDKYIAARKSLHNGYVAVSIVNQSPVSVAHIVVGVALVNAAGVVVAEDRIPIGGILGPGEGTSVLSRLGPLSSEDQFRATRVQVLRASIAE